MRAFWRLIAAAGLGACMFVSGCSKQVFTDKERTQLYDITSLVEERQIAYYNVIESSIPDRLARLLQTDSNFANSLSTSTLDASKPLLALTFNAGPDEKVTAQILDILEENSARATFFVDPANINDTTAPLLKRMTRLGCEVAYYMAEPGEMAYLSESDMKKELNDSIQKIEHYSGRECKLARPYGGYVQDVVIEKMKQPLILWSVDTQDAVLDDAASIRSAAQTYAGDGEIILMHDQYESTVNAVRNMIPDLMKDGYQLVTVSELAYMKDVTLKAGEEYYSITKEEPETSGEDDSSEEEDLSEDEDSDAI